MIVGIGVDSIEISRVVKAMEKEHFLHRIFTEREISQLDSSKRRGASDFAGKEAVVKALGTGFDGMEAGDIEILRNDKGAPYVVLQGKAKAYADQLGIDEWKISVTNTKELATAFVVALSGNSKD